MLKYMNTESGHSNIATNDLKRNNGSKAHYLPTPTSHIYALLIVILTVFITVIIVEKKLPAGLHISNEDKYVDRFIAERAMRHLINLTNIGPRIVSSHENEVLATNYFLDVVTGILKNAKSNHIIEVDIQKSSGAFQLDFLDGLTNVYRNVQSVIVKIGSNIKSQHSLLINCHYDTVADSPGGSDDGAGCVVMLEILRVLSQSDRILKHNIIFLFNGAEENLMQASHGFITKHKWAHEVRAFINLEACGAGGREILFQAGPRSPWIMHTYSNTVPYPYASSLAQEIFQSGIIPGETDFRIFRDFGKVSGLDFAWSTNGYVYHTKFDTVKQIPLGTLQRTGDNILALAIGMANGHQLSDIAQNNESGLVFFDFLGAFVVRWPFIMADIINILSLMISFYSIYRNMITAKKQGITKSSYLKHVASALKVVIFSWAISLCFNLIVGWNLTLLNRQMSWYARPMWLFFLYVIPTLFVGMLVLVISVRNQRKNIDSPWVLFQLYYDAVHLFWCAALLCTIVLKVRSGFIALLWVIFASLGNFAREFFFRHYRDKKWLLLHIVTFSLPFVQSFYLVLAALYMFVPIMGRSGASVPSEYIMAGMVSLEFSCIFSFVTILILLCRSPERVINILAGVFFISMTLLIFTPLGFPYSGDNNAPAPQRYMIFHTQRIFHDENSKVYKADSGFWIVDMDVNSPTSVQNIVPEMSKAVYDPEACSKDLFCGYPYLLPVIKFLSFTHWIPAPAPKLPLIADIALNNKQLLNQTTWRYSFTVTGPFHIGLMLSAKLGVSVQGWSIDDNKPLKGEPFNGRDTYFVYYGCAADPVPWNFHVDLRVESTVKTDLMLDVAVCGHYLHGKYKADEEFNKFLSTFPSWTTVTSWTSTYNSYVF